MPQAPTVEQTVMVEPPLDAGAVKLILALPLPPKMAVMLGAPGTVVLAVGVTLLDAAEAAPVPIALVAVTVKV